MAEMEDGGLPDVVPRRGGPEDDEDSERDEDDIDWIVWDEEEGEDEAEVDTHMNPSNGHAPSERSGHIAVVDGNYMYVWGGYKNAEATGSFELYLPHCEIWIYNMETQTWKMQLAGGELPAAMSGSCGVCVDGVLYVFGGHHTNGNTNLVYRLPLRSPLLCWEKMNNLKGLAPTCKDKLGCWVYKNSLVFFGGYGYFAQEGHRGIFEFDETSFIMGNHIARGWNNHVHVLDLETLTWSQPITTGTTPSPRAAHACATVGNRGYVFGGRYMNYRLNDLYYINLDTWEWSEMSVPQNGPDGRSWHSFTPVSQDRIFLYGGFTTSRQTLSDAWLYCISKNEWKPIKHKYTDQPRLWHTACHSPEGEVFVFGGCANNLLSRERAAHSNELLVFNVQPKSLSRLSMEAVVQHREQLEGVWDSLPKHLLHSVKQRMSSGNTMGS